MEDFYQIFLTWNDILNLFSNQPWWVQKNYVMPIRNTFELSSCFQFKNLIFIIALIQPVENNPNQPPIINDTDNDDGCIKNVETIRRKKTNDIIIHNHFIFMSNII